MAADEVVFPLYLLFLFWTAALLFLWLGQAVEQVNDRQLDSVFHHLGGYSAVDCPCVGAWRYSQPGVRQHLEYSGYRRQSADDYLYRYFHVASMAVDAGGS